MLDTRERDKARWQPGDPLHYYLAQISANIKSLFGEHVPVDAALLKFEHTEAKAASAAPVDPLLNKHIWLGILGIQLPPNE